MTDLPHTTTKPLEECIRNAVAEASEDPAPTSIEEACRAELVDLWDDLGTARHYAINEMWSMKCDSVVHRILNLTRIVGPTPWEQVPTRVLWDRVYQQVYDAAGIDYEAPDMDAVAGMVTP